MHRIQFWGEFLIFLIFLPLEIWHKLLCCHNFETICNTCERGVFYYLVWSHDQVMQEQWEYYFLIPLKNSSEFFILLHFQELIRVLDIGTLLQVMLAILTFVRIQLYFVLRLFRSHCPAWHYGNAWDLFG